MAKGKVESAKQSAPADKVSPYFHLIPNRAMRCFCYLIMLKQNAASSEPIVLNFWDFPAVKNNLEDNIKEVACPLDSNLVSSCCASN